MYDLPAPPCTMESFLNQDLFQYFMTTNYIYRGPQGGTVERHLSPKLTIVTSDSECTQGRAGDKYNFMYFNPLTSVHVWLHL